MTYRIGDRVHVNARYRGGFPRSRATAGTVVGGSRWPSCVRVEWDGLATITTISEDFVAPAWTSPKMDEAYFPQGVRTSKPEPSHYRDAVQFLADHGNAPASAQFATTLRRILWRGDVAA